MTDIKISAQRLQKLEKAERKLNACAPAAEAAEISDSFLNNPDGPAAEAVMVKPVETTVSREAMAAIQAELDHLFEIERYLDDAGWQPIATAPRNRPIVVYAPPRHDLPEFAGMCQWHPDAGFCVCELREPTHWMEKP
jgi:hypothetical protein